MVAWPASLPKMKLPVSEEPQDPFLRSTMDAGPAKVRPRYSAIVRTLKAPVELTRAQRQTFDDFFMLTLQKGTLPFDWTDPVTAGLTSMRFVSVPKWTWGLNDKCSATLELEILP